MHNRFDLLFYTFQYALSHFDKLFCFLIYRNILFERLVLWMGRKRGVTGGIRAKLRSVFIIKIGLYNDRFSGCKAIVYYFVK